MHERGGEGGGGGGRALASFVQREQVLFVSLSELTVYKSSLITMLKLLHATTKMIAVTSGRE